MTMSNETVELEQQNQFKMLPLTSPEKSVQLQSSNNIAPLPSTRANAWHNIALLNRVHCFGFAKKTNKWPEKSQELEEGIQPTMEVDSADCKKPRKGGWKAMPYVIGNEICERLAVTGLHSNMIVYLRTRYNMKTVKATNTLNIWSGTTSLATLVGAFVADSYLGRFRTIFIGCVADSLGMFILTLSALIPRSRPPPCNALQRHLGKCESASPGQSALLISFFALMSVGSGGIRPCSMAFGADQFDQNGQKGKERIRSFFNWYYFASCASLMVALTVIIYIQSTISWSLGFGISTILMLISTIFFVVGRPLYLRVTPEGSPFTGFAQVIVASMKKRNLSMPSDPSKLYRLVGRSDEANSNVYLTDQFRFLNKAAIITEGDLLADGSPVSPWRLCTAEQTEQLKSIIRTLPIFSCGIVNSITIAQQHTFSVLQALTMDRKLGSHFQIPAGSFSVFTLLVLVAWLPFYERVFVRFARRLTKRRSGISMFQRLGIGFGISAIAMLVAGFVEVKRRNTARRHGLLGQPSAIAPISAFWLLPQYCIVGLAEAFHAIGHLEFFYDQFPPNMRSTAIALSSCTVAIGQYLSSMIVSLIHNTTGRNGRPDWLADNLNQGHLEYFYWLLSALGAVNLIYFIACARWYKFRQSPVVDSSRKSDASDFRMLHR